MSSDWIQTVKGPVAVESLGLMLPHEHLFTDLRGPGIPDYAQAEPQDVVRVMMPYLDEARAAGITLLVECTPPGVGRNIEVMQLLAQSSPVHLVMPTGVYREAFLPVAYHDISLESLADLFISELNDGIEGTAVRAGFIKLAVSEEGITPRERRNLQAAALASQQTGAVIASHTIGGKLAQQEMDILEAAGLKMDRFIWVHAQTEPDQSIHLEAAQRGAWIELDAIGVPEQMEIHLNATIALIQAGYSGSILLSHDAGWYQPGQQGGVLPDQEIRGYTSLVNEFLPALRRRGISEDLIRKLTVTNPARAFAFGQPAG
jgi:phosphotriesterase-related protein